MERSLRLASTILGAWLIAAWVANGQQPELPIAAPTADHLAAEAATPPTEAMRLFVEGRYADALAAAVRDHAAALARSGPDHSESLQAANNLAVIQARAGKLADAKALATATLDARRKLLGPDHPDVFTTLNNLGTIEHTLGDYAEAEKTLQEAYDGRKRLLGDKHPSTAQSMANLGRVMMARGKRAEGVKLLEEALAVQLADPSTPKTSLAATKCSVAKARVESSGALATQDAQDAREAAAAAFGESHPRYALALAMLARSRLMNIARDDFSKARDIHRDAGSVESPDFAMTLLHQSEHAVGFEHGFGLVFPTQANITSALTISSEARRACEQTFGPKHDTTATATIRFAQMKAADWHIDRVQNMPESLRLIKESLATLKTTHVSRQYERLVYNTNSSSLGESFFLEKTPDENAARDALPDPFSQMKHALATDPVSETPIALVFLGLAADSFPPAASSTDVEKIAMRDAITSFLDILESMELDDTYGANDLQTTLGRRTQVRLVNQLVAMSETQERLKSVWEAAKKAGTAPNSLGEFGGKSGARAREAAQRNVGLARRLVDLDGIYNKLLLDSHLDLFYICRVSGEWDTAEDSLRALRQVRVENDDWGPGDKDPFVFQYRRLVDRLSSSFKSQRDTYAQYATKPSDSHSKDTPPSAPDKTLNVQ